MLIPSPWRKWKMIACNRHLRARRWIHCCLFLLVCAGFISAADLSSDSATAAPNAEDEERKHFHLSLFYGSTDSVAEILDRHPDWLSQPLSTPNTDTPLQYVASLARNPGLVELLLKRGANPWLRNAAGDSPLDTVLPSSSGNSIFRTLRRLDATYNWRPARMEITRILYRSQYDPINLGILATFLLSILIVALWTRKWVREREVLVKGAVAEKALDQISARPDWKELLAKFEKAQSFQRRVYLHRPWILIGAIGWVGGLALMWFDPVLTLLVEPGAWWLAWIFTGTFLLGSGLQFARRPAWRILGAAIGIITLAVSCFYCGIGVYLIWTFPQLYLLAAAFGAMVLATLTAAGRFHRTLKAEIGLMRIKLPPELELARLTHDGADIDHPGGWDESTAAR